MARKSLLWGPRIETNEYRKRKKHADCSRYLPFACNGAEDCARRRAKRLAACVNVTRSPVESFYTWKGRLESAREHLLIIKTTAKRLSGLEKEVRRLHSYDVPEFIAVPVVAGSESYLHWLSEATAAR